MLLFILNQKRELSVNYDSKKKKKKRSLKSITWKMEGVDGCLENCFHFLHGSCFKPQKGLDENVLSQRFMPRERISCFLRRRFFPLPLFAIAKWESLVAAEVFSFASRLLGFIDERATARKP